MSAIVSMNCPICLNILYGLPNMPPFLYSLWNTQYLLITVSPRNNVTVKKLHTRNNITVNIINNIRQQYMTSQKCHYLGFTLHTDYLGAGQKKDNFDRTTHIFFTCSEIKTLTQTALFGPKSGRCMNNPSYLRNLGHASVLKKHAR